MLSRKMQGLMAGAALLLGASSALATDAGNSFTYQGRLSTNGQASTGLYDIAFTLWDSATLGSMISTVYATNVVADDGLFTCRVNFGAAPFTGDARWISMAVRPAGQGSYVPLNGRQELTPTPYALSAATVQVPTSASGDTDPPQFWLTPPGLFAISQSGDANGIVGVTYGNGAAIYGYGAGDDSSAAVFWNGIDTNADSAVKVYNDGTGAAVYAECERGRAGFFEITNSANNAAVLRLETDGGGKGLEIVQTKQTSVADGLHVLNFGGGSAGHFVNFGGSNPALFVQSFGTGPAMIVSGTAQVEVLEVTGADVAEKFPVSEEATPGMVLMIDAEHPGSLCLARGAYNPRVAGVVSGANGLPAGTILGNLPGHEKSTPIALSGRVWVWCDASDKAIEPGDLMTTSERAGYAMSATDHVRAGGATIGKAMSSLARGETGMVLVLVNLQ